MDLYNENQMDENLEVQPLPELPTPEELRELRRKRRKKAESKATTLAVVLVLAICVVMAAGVIGIRYLAGPGVVTTETEDEMQELVDNMLASEETLPTEVIDVVTPEE